MAVRQYIERTVKKPFVFMCDICKQQFVLQSEYDIDNYGDVAKQMAVIKYSYPVGAYQERTESAELDCCSASCLARALSKVPFGAEITIPFGGFFDRDK
jgi:hypothetical protein